MTFSSRVKGFSLIEVLVSSLMIAATGVGLFTMQVTSLNMTEHSQNRQRALYLAEEQLETFRGYASNGDVGEVSFSSIQTGEKVVPMSVDYHLSWQVTELVLGREGKAKMISLIVSWVDGQQKSRTLKLSTVLASRPFVSDDIVNNNFG